MDTNLYKIGRSKNLLERFEGLKTQSCYPLKLMKFCYFEDFSYHEKRIHKVVSAWRTHGEWFELPDFIVRSANLWFSNPDCIHISFSESGEVIETRLEKKKARNSVKLKREKPYEVQQGEGGLFIAAGLEPIDSPPVHLRMTASMYKQLEEIAAKNKAQWIREAIAQRLQRESQ